MKRSFFQFYHLILNFAENIDLENVWGGGAACHPCNTNRAGSTPCTTIVLANVFAHQETNKIVCFRKENLLTGQKYKIFHLFKRKIKNFSTVERGKKKFLTCMNLLKLST